MKAVGFDTTLNTTSIVDGKLRSIITLRDLPKDDFKKVIILPHSILTLLRTRRDEVEVELQNLTSAPILSRVVRIMRAHHNIHEITTAIETLHRIISNILLYPYNNKYYIIYTNNKSFIQTIGRLNQSESLMNFIGFYGSGLVPQAESIPEPVADHESTPTATNSNTAKLSVPMKAGKAHPTSTSKAHSTNSSSVVQDVSTIAQYHTPQYKEYIFDKERAYLNATTTTHTNTHNKSYVSSDNTDTNLLQQYLYHRKADLELTLKLLDEERLAKAALKIGHNSGGDRNPKNHNNLVSGILPAPVTSFSPLRTHPHTTTHTTATTTNNNNNNNTIQYNKQQHLQTIKNMYKDFISLFSTGATSAQILQLQMILEVFINIDSDYDGYLSLYDIKAYFRSLGQPHDDVTVLR